MKLLTITNCVWLLAYLGLIALIYWGLTTYRAEAIAQFNSPQAKTDWKEWVMEVESQAGQAGPVSRKVPKSSEPPTLVMLRDHFASCLGGAFMLTTALFVTLMVMIRGSLHGRGDMTDIGDEFVLPPTAGSDTENG